MVYYTTGAESAAIDKETIEDIGIPQLVLMERAALALAEETVRAAGICVSDSRNSTAGCCCEGRKGRVRILVVCEGGNNGGDGVACARILHAWGYKADILYIGGLKKVSEAFLKQKSIAERCGVNFLEVDKNDSRDKAGGFANESGHPDRIGRLVRGYDIVIDSIFGVGLTRDVKGVQAEVVDAINKAKSDDQDMIVISADIPSGISSENGNILGTAVRADITVSFGFTKLGMLFGKGREYSGRIITRDIGFTNNADIKHYGFNIYDVRRLLPVRRADANKGSFGRLLLVAGNSEISGAAVIAAQAAYRMGAGLVKVLTDKRNRDIIGAAVPEAMMVCYDENMIRGAESRDELEEASDAVSIESIVDNSVRWATAVAVGPGLGTDVCAVKLLKTVLDAAERYEKPVVIDADAINIIAADNCILKKYASGDPADALKVESRLQPEAETVTARDKRSGRGRWIITPHMLEMARLMKCDVADIRENRFDIAKNASNEYNIISVLKDARTVVSDGTDSFYINTNGNSGMSKGGSGDSLTGIIGSLLAQGMKPLDAARAGVFIHGAAGDIAAGKYGLTGMTVTELNDSIVDVLRAAQ